jgi:putative DNA primase/helicase
MFMKDFYRSNRPNDGGADDWVGRARDADIFAVARDLQPKLKRVSSMEYAGPCPAGCASTDGFVVNQKKRVFLCRPSGAAGDAIAMTMHCLGVDFIGAVEHITGMRRPRARALTVDEQLRGSEECARPVHEAARWLHESEAADAAHAFAMRQAALRIWSATSPIAGTLGEKYFRSRAITCPLSDELRFMPELEHWPTRQMWPAVVARVTGSEGVFFAVHLTFLTADGLSNAALGEKRKLMLGPVKGGAVKFAEPMPGKPLYVGEGIESSLSGLQVTGCPTWAALSTSGLRALELPRAVRDVTILADADDPGEAAAIACRRRWKREGRRARIVRPTNRGQDFNDMLRNGGFRIEEKTL